MEDITIKLVTHISDSLKTTEKRVTGFLSKIMEVFIKVNGKIIYKTGSEYLIIIMKFIKESLEMGKGR